MQFKLKKQNKEEFLDMKLVQNTVSVVFYKTDNNQTTKLSLFSSDKIGEKKTNPGYKPAR